MTHFIGRRGFLALLPAPLLAQELPAAKAILDRYIKETGGAASYARIKTESMEGTMEMKAAGLKGKMSGVKSKDLSYNVLELEGVGKVEEGWDGSTAWEKSAIAGPRVMSGEEAAFRSREAIVGKDAKWESIYASAKTTGIEDINGEECYVVVLTPKTGKPETRYYSRKTGLLTKVKFVMTSQMGEVPFEATVGDYKKDPKLGILASTKQVAKMAGQEMVLTTDKLTYNEPVPDERFTPPADVLAVAAKAKK